MIDETPFGETNALLAIIRNTPTQAQAILDEMYPAELAKLANAADTLAYMARVTRSRKLAPGYRPG